MEIALAIIVAVLGTFLGGIVLKIYQDKAHLFRITASSDGVDYSVYQGRWYGAHLSKIEGADCVISNHEYNLKITKEGKVSGKFIDNLASPRWVFVIEGIISGSGLTIVAESKGVRTGHYSSEFYPTLHEDKINFGILSSTDGNNDPFSSPIVLSRRKYEGNNGSGLASCFLGPVNNSADP